MTRELHHHSQVTVPENLKNLHKSISKYIIAMRENLASKPELWKALLTELVNYFGGNNNYDNNFLFIAFSNFIESTFNVVLTLNLNAGIIQELQKLKDTLINIAASYSQSQQSASGEA